MLMTHFTVFYGNAAGVSEVLVMFFFCFFCKILHTRVRFYRLWLKSESHHNSSILTVTIKHDRTNM